jgi:hypothetical protein
MKVFISWSGDMSHKIAVALGAWLPSVIQAVKPFVSSRDIAAGDRWGEVLADELAETRFGIICITPFNLRAPWLNFESGALSKTVDRSSVVPLLCGVDRSLVHGPLAQFQSTLFTREEMAALLCSLNDRLAEESRLSAELLRRTFDLWWPQLEKDLSAIDATDGETETGYPWLITAEDLARREFNPLKKAVWVITPMPSEDVQFACLMDALRRNIDQGVQYTFFVPSDPAESSAQDLRRRFKDKIKVQEVEREKFDSLAVTHYVVLNPDCDDDCSPRVFLEVPVVQPGYWVEVRPDAAINLTNRFRLMIQPDPCLRAAIPADDAASAAALPS